MPIDRDFITKESSLTAVADAIRAKGRTSAELTYPAGFVSAISAIGNHYTGGTVAWNQKITSYRTSGYIYGLTFVNNNNKSISVSGTVDTAFTNNQCSMTGNITFIRDGRKYLITLNKPVSRNMGVIGYGGSIVSGRTGGFFTQTAASSWNASIYISAPVGTELDVEDLTIQVFDVTAMFGKDIADYLYTLESGTAGAGVAKFRELYPDDNYANQTTPVLMSFKPGDWPVNAGTELRGILTLDGDGWHRDADEYNNGVVLRKYMQADMDNVGINWRYNDTYDYFYTGDLYNNIGALKIDDTSSISFITDAYPTGGMILSTQGPADMADGYIYQKSRDTSIGQGIILYVKDTSITSDHLNTFMTKIAGKKLVIKKSTSSYYNP